tara:strand:- start:83439 stop:83894 length:456 start_codon:yes stop_codon:yes gene_type:complete
MHIKIHKSQHLLELWGADKLLHRFPIGVGKSTDGPKLKRNDMRTPEGEYHVIVKNPQSKYFLSIGLNYPNRTDAWRSFKKGIITAETCQRICSAHEHNQRIPWDTDMGGEIYIHGHLEERDWSEGCIRLYQDDIEALYNAINLDTPVSIQP